MRRSLSPQQLCRSVASVVLPFVVLLAPLMLSSHSRCQETTHRKLAQTILQRGGIQRGVASVLACDEVVLDLVGESQLLVHVRDPRTAQIARLRGRLDEAGIGIDRVVVEQGALQRLPFADNMVDLIVTTQITSKPLEVLALNDVLRVLRPQGTAILGKALRSDGPDPDLAQLKQQAEQAGAQRVEVWEDAQGAWLQFYKPSLPGIDEWTHWEKGPDNNPVSNDAMIKAPYMTQFMAAPLYIGMPSITTAAGGRTFLAIGHIAHHRREWDTLYKLIARNGYNGTVLWERTLPDGYLVHRSAFIATGDTFYLINGDHCLMLDPQTGQDKGAIRLPGVDGHWKWMAMKDNVLYVLTGDPDPKTQATKGDRTFGGWSWADLSRGYYGKQIPFGFGGTLAAYDMQQEKLLWRHDEEKSIDARSMAVREGKVFLFCPEQHLRCLAADTGEVLWTNAEANVRNLIEEPGRGLTSTPGFRTACLVVATPEALIIQGQTRMNVVAVSTEDGYVLWTKRKITNNPNAIYVNGQVILGVGPGGTHVALDPVTGEVQEELKFQKVACTRLTASGDSFFCRGEGMMRFDRESKKVLIDGAVRPACNDGALPANGMLYLGPWQCDCNLSLIGNVARCSAGDFRFDHVATQQERLQLGDGDLEQVAPLEISDMDWPTYRGDNHRTAAARARAASNAVPKWTYDPGSSYTPTAPTAAGGLVFTCGSDGVVRALEGGSGQLRWKFPTGGPIKYPPSIWEGRAYVGSGDGYAYALEAATGRLLWRFRAAPVERHIMVYGNLSSTWPVHSGVLVQDGVAYFAAGIIDHDGTYVYALDARTGELKWQNNSSGHLNPELRKGVSVQGNLTVLGNQLLLAGGNQVSPAQFDLNTGRCLSKPFDQGRPKANGGRFLGVFQNVSVIAGGRILHSAAENVSTKGSFVAFSRDNAYQFNQGGVPPAWNGDTMAVVNFKHGQLTCCDANKVAQRIDKGYGEPAPGQRRWLNNLFATLESDGAVKWQGNLGEPNKFEVVSLAVCPQTVIAVLQYQQQFRSQPQWYVVSFDIESGRRKFQRELPGSPLPDGLLVDREGRVILCMLDGRIVAYGA